MVRCTITELAEKADTSEPTVVRFCRKMGLQGYMDLRLNLARDLPSAQYIHETVDKQDTPVQVMEKIFTAKQEALSNTLNKIDMKVFDQAVNLLVKARRIEFYGFGGSGMVALDAHHKFFRLGVPCIAYQDSHLQVMSAALLDSDRTAGSARCTFCIRRDEKIRGYQRKSGQGKTHTDRKAILIDLKNVV